MINYTFYFIKIGKYFYNFLLSDYKVVDWRKASEGNIIIKYIRMNVKFLYIIENNLKYYSNSLINIDKILIDNYVFIIPSI